MASIRITSGVDIAVPPRQAWDVIADFSRNPEWQGGMRSCEWLTPPPVEVGSRYRQEAGFLGRAITTTFEVVALERRDDGGGRITIDSVVSTFPLAITREVVGTSRGCRVRADVAGSPDGLLGKLGPVMTRLVKRSVDADYVRLKTLLEG